MKQSSSILLPPSTRAPALPAWLAEMASFWKMERRETNLSGGGDEQFQLLRLRVPSASQLSAEQFQASAEQAYLTLARQIDSSATRHPVRFWNYIPHIHQASDTGQERYMVFNAGRFAACRRWLGDGGASFERFLPTASAVGHTGADLFIDALTCLHPGRAIENPRQVPSYQYSRKYGPFPPCFARATRTDFHGTPTLLVGGTASIIGEDSTDSNNLSAQIEQTLANLSSLVNAGLQLELDASAALARFIHLRVYHVNLEDRDLIRSRIRNRFASVGQIEFVAAELCRSELLVEIEGLAQ